MANQAAGGPPPLSKFRLKRRLAEDPRRKAVTLLGGLDDHEGDAVLRAEWQHPGELVMSRLYQGPEQPNESVIFHNDVYSKVVVQAPAGVAALTIDVIYPATQKHIDKYSAVSSSLVLETPDVYRRAVLPVIEATPPSRIQWVYNILDGSSEAERVIFRDEDCNSGFVLLPDSKWDGNQIEALYCIGIARRRDVRSLRDVTADHLALLRHMRDAGAAAIKSRYNVPQDKLRMFIHYQPSYYHLHVHFMHVDFDGSFGMAAGTAHLLDTVIANIETFGSDFYSRAVLTYPLAENNPLLEAIQACAAPAAGV